MFAETRKAPPRPATPPTPPSPLAVAAEEFNEAASSLSTAIRDFEATLNKHSAQVNTVVESDKSWLDDNEFTFVRLRWERVKSGEWRIHRIEYKGDDRRDDDTLLILDNKFLIDCSIEQRVEAAPLLKKLADALVLGMKERTQTMREAVRSLRGIVDEMGGW